MNNSYSGPIKTFPQYYPDGDLSNSQRLVQQPPLQHQFTTEERHFAHPTPVQVVDTVVDRHLHTDNFDRENTNAMNKRVIEEVTVVKEVTPLTKPVPVMRTEPIIQPTPVMAPVVTQQAQPLKMAYNQYHQNTFRESGSAYFR